MAPATVCMVEIEQSPGQTPAEPRVIDFRLRTENTYGEVYLNSLEAAGGRRILAIQDADAALIFGRGMSIHINQDSFFLGPDLLNMRIEKPNVRVLVSPPAPPSPPISPPYDFDFAN